MICRYHEIPMPEVGIYPSREINAFATGRPGDSLIAISTGLIKNFTDEEIKGVLAHEASHLAHKDLRFILIIQGISDLIVMALSSLAFYAVLIGNTRKNDEHESLGSQIFRIFVAVIVYHVVTTILRFISIAIVC